MKRSNRSGSILAILGLIAIVAVGTALAQSLNPVMIVRVPFQFTVGDRTLPAGEYRILREHQSVVRLEDGSGKGVANIIVNLTEAKRAPEEGKLIFHGYSGRYFLKEVWRAGSIEGQVLPTTRTEREIARKQKPIEVALLARLAGDTEKAH